MFMDDARRLALTAQLLLTSNPSQMEQALFRLGDDTARLRTRLGKVKGQSSLRRGIITPLIDKALEISEATAWVAANDGVALECMDLLRKRGVRVPRELSLAGFDNTLEAFFQKVTSLDYNAPALMRSMVEHLLAPRRAAARPPLPTEVPGVIVERGTTAPPGSTAATSRT